MLQQREEAEADDPTKEAEESNKPNIHHCSNVLVPVNLKSLAGLEANVGLLKYSISPDMLVWLGTGRWSGWVPPNGSPVGVDAIHNCEN